MTALFRRTRRAAQHAADAPTEYIPRQPAGVPQGASRFGDNPHGVASDVTLAALVAKAGAHQPGAMGATPTLPHAVAWRNGVQPWTEVIPMVPLTLPASIYDAMGGDEKTARPCGHCGALSRPEDVSWRYDAHQAWSCPSCQAQPEWHAPSLPGLRVTTPDGNPGSVEAGIMARSLLATRQRCVRQRPDGQWVAAVPVGGRIKAAGPFGSEAEAQAAYGYVLGVFTDAVTGKQVAA